MADITTSQRELRRKVQLLEPIALQNPSNNLRGSALRSSDNEPFATGSELD